MARAALAIGGTNLKVYVDLHELEQRSEAFKESRRQIGRDVREGVQAAAERAVLPEARRRFGSGKVASTLVVRKGTRQSAYITSTLRGKKGRFVGLLEFGGVVTTLIRPKRRQALVINGNPVAEVSTPRRYKARLWITSAVRSRFSAFEKALMQDVERALRRWF
jgi:hypothetical protein